MTCPLRGAGKYRRLVHEEYSSYFRDCGEGYINFIRLLVFNLKIDHCPTMLT